MDWSSVVNISGLVGSILSVIAFVWMVHDYRIQNGGISRTKIIMLVITAIVLFAILALLSYTWDYSTNLLTQEGVRHHLKKEYSDEGNKSTLINYPLSYRNPPNLDVRLTVDSDVKCAPEVLSEKEYGFEVKVHGDNCSINWKANGLPSNGVRLINSAGVKSWQKLVKEGIEGENIDDIENAPEWIKKGEDYNGMFSSHKLTEQIGKGFNQLDWADLRGYSLHRYELDSNKNYKQEYIYLNGANLSFVDFRGADISNIFLEGANIKNTIFDGSSLKLIDLSGADLSRTSFKNTLLDDIKLQGSMLSENDFSGSKVKSVKLSGNKINNGVFSQASVEDSDFSGAVINEYLIHWEIPRLCRGDVHSLTYPEVHPETLKREPPSTCKGESEWTSLKA